MAQYLENSQTVRLRRATSDGRVIDGRETLLRGLVRLEELQAQLQVFFSDLRRQQIDLARIRYSEHVPFGDRARARQLSRSTRAHLNDVAHLSGAINGLIVRSRSALDSVHEADRIQSIRMHDDDSTRVFLHMLDVMERNQSAYIRESPQVLNQALIGRYDHAMLEDAQVLYDGDPDQGAAFGVWGGPMGSPEAINSYRRGYYASWESMARLFSQGEFIHGDSHHRRVMFDEGRGGYAEFQAHVPQLATSSRSNAMVALGSIGGAVLGAVAGFVVGNVAGAVMGAVGAATGAVAGAVVIRHGRPRDAASQLYTAQYFARVGDVEPWGTREFLGWALSPSYRRAIELDGEYNPNRFYDLADNWKNFSWWNGRGSAAAPRPPDLVYSSGWAVDGFQRAAAAAQLALTPNAATLRREVRDLSRLGDNANALASADASRLVQASECFAAQPQAAYTRCLTCSRDVTPTVQLASTP